MPPRHKMNERRRKILDYIQWYAQENGVPPTIREIRDGCELSSTSVVDYNLRVMEKHGHVRRRPDLARSIELLDETGRPMTTGVARIQIVGDITAGSPIPAFTNEPAIRSHEFDVIEVPAELVEQHGKLYALRVQGASMADALIDDGDVVVVRPTTAAENGDTVVAWLRREEAATLKKYYRTGEAVHLQPANQGCPPIQAPANDVEIRGQVVKIVREL